MSLLGDDGAVKGPVIDVCGHVDGACRRSDPWHTYIHVLLLRCTMKGVHMGVPTHFVPHASCLSKVHVAELGVGAKALAR